MTSTNRSFVLSIAGFDPSAGAGVLADIKTFEQTGAYGLGVTTALTYQTDTKFDGLEWVSKECLFSQLEPLFLRFDIKVAKIGLIQNLEILNVLLRALECRRVSVIWDPIVSASAGFTFHNNFIKDALKNTLSRVCLVTPNWNEVEYLGVGDTPLQAAKELSRSCPVLLKGGHSTEKLVTDYYFDNFKSETFTSERLVDRKKHGSGCVLSAAIASYLAQGLEMIQAIRLAREYTKKILLSNDSLLGYHT